MFLQEALGLTTSTVKSKPNLPLASLPPCNQRPPSEAETKSVKEHKAKVPPNESF